MPVKCWKYYRIQGLICDYWIVFNSGSVTRRSPPCSEHTWIQMAVVLILSLIQIWLQDWKQANVLLQCSYWCALSCLPCSHSSNVVALLLLFICCLSGITLLSAVSHASLALFQGCAPQGGDIGVVLARALPACTLQQECIDLLPITGSCLCKNVLKAFWIDQFIIYYCLEELRVCKWSYEGFGLQYSFPYDGILCKGDDFTAIRDLSAIAAERGHKEENVICLLVRYNLTWTCQHFCLLFLTNFECLEVGVSIQIPDGGIKMETRTGENCIWELRIDLLIWKPEHLIVFFLPCCRFPSTDPDTDLKQGSCSHNECSRCVLLKPFPTVCKITNGRMMNSLSLCCLPPPENVIPPRSC